MENSDRVIEEIQQIKAQYKTEVAGVRKAWPRAIKDRVLKLASDGVRLREVADRTGISYHTLASWTAKAEFEKFHSLPVVRKSTNSAIRKNVATVTVTKSSKSGVVSKIATVTIKTPDGFVIRLGSARDAVTLLKSLGQGR